MSAMALPLSPQGAGDTWVWDAFRALRTDGRSIYATLAPWVAHLATEAPGDTLEIGGGDGHLWREPGSLDAVTRVGRLFITDFDAALVERCRTLPHLARAGVSIGHADVTHLPFATGAFQQVIATHVLHWCGTPRAVDRALGEIARVLRGRGHAIIVTADEAIHMRELYALFAQVSEELAETGESVAPMPSQAPRILPFCAGNAREALERAFHTVRRVDCDYAHVVEATHPTLGFTAADFVVAYARTLPFLQERLARDELCESFFAHLHRTVAKRAPLRWSRRDAIYECSR
jgi:SAM-dependent methyltransferase